MQEFLRAIICTTTVFAIIGLTMMVRNIYGIANTNDRSVEITSIEEIEDFKTTMEQTSASNAQQPENGTDSTGTSTEEREPTRHKIRGRLRRPILMEIFDPPTDEVNESTETHPQDEATKHDVLYSAKEFMVRGVIRWDGWRWTWYSEKVLPGGGLKIPGRHNDDNGYVCDEDDYICLASSTLSKGTVIDTPFGKQGKVYDTGCAADIVDVYVSW